MLAWFVYVSFIASYFPEVREHCVLEFQSSHSVINFGMIGQDLKTLNSILIITLVLMCGCSDAWCFCGCSDFLSLQRMCM